MGPKKGNQIDRVFKKAKDEKLCILTVCDINKLQVACFMFRARYNIPQYFNSMFTLNSSVHSYITRHNNDFHLAKLLTSVYKDHFYGTPCPLS